MTVSRPCRPQAIPVRPVHASSFERRPSASASSSPHDCLRIFVSSSGVPSAAKRTLPSTMSHPIKRATGPGQWTSTGRPAICDAIAPSRCSFPCRSRQSAIHHATAAASTPAAVSFTHSGVVGCFRVIAEQVSARAIRP